MRNKYVILGQYCEDIDDIQTELLSDKKVILIDYDSMDEEMKGKYITIEDFDDIIANDNGYANYWYEKVFIKNPIVVENQTEIDLPKGDYQIYAVDDMEG